MTICLKCHRPLKHPTESGLGPVCAKTANPSQEVERDLFGYDAWLAAEAAMARLELFIAAEVALAKHEIRQSFREARQALWS